MAESAAPSLISGKLARAARVVDPPRFARARGAAAKRNPGRAARGAKIAKSDESAAQKLTRTPPVKAVLFKWAKAKPPLLLALAKPPVTALYITPP